MIALVAVVWGVFRSESDAVVEVTTAVRVVIEVAVFAAAAAALAAVGRVGLAIVFAVRRHQRDPELRPRLALVDDPGVSTGGTRLLIAAGEPHTGVPQRPRQRSADLRRFCQAL
jgi:Protein of unknown function (DUF2568)